VGLVDVFIGVVTHPGSRYADAAGPAGAGAEIAAALAPLGLVTEVCVEDRNLWSDTGQSVAKGSHAKSLRAELREEWAWRTFLATANWRSRGVLIFRWLRLLLRRYRGGSSSAVERLLNIEFAHRRPWQCGLNSGAAVVLVLEDDAFCEDPVDTAYGLAELIEQEWVFANLSQSFTSKELGIGSLLENSGMNWNGPGGLGVRRRIYRTAKPVTNTVCAVAYRRHFLQNLVSHWDSMPQQPVLPIDWKLNRALREMSASDALGAEPALWIEPAPLLQRSLHPHTSD